MSKPLFVALLLLLGPVACSPAPTAPKVAPAQRRIVSLMPSLTEDLLAVGAGGELVGVDEFSGQSRFTARLPKVGNFSSIDTERIVQLHPDVVVGIPAQERLLLPLRQAGISIVLLADDSFEDIFRVLGRLGDLTGHPARARTLEAALRARTRALQANVHFKHRPSVFVVLDTSPIYTAGRDSYIGALIRLAGGRNAADNLPVAYASYSPEALLRLQPEVIVTDASTGLLGALQNEPWRSLRAVQQGHVYVVEPREILERPGPRYNQGLSWLIARLRPLAQ